ncbi:uncharacterized protein LOC131641650 [Vicia villosa]|uniref:uncharacterized protein LOC131641650 n=1 Tax=Vicia villosa TaxID=3911 RepID=UPI00273CBD64|nr:uncharacterized protein LOC131641650 [Vicia villosa]
MAVYVICGKHNHALDTKQQGHPIVGRLKPEEKEIISKMSIIKVSPRNILADLKHKRSQNVSNIKYIWCDDKVSVRDIFWTHTESIKLSNTYPTVLIIDSTYKTNKYRLPLLEIVGVTSTEKTFSV